DSDPESLQFAWHIDGAGPIGSGAVFYLDIEHFREADGVTTIDQIMQYQTDADGKLVIAREAGRREVTTVVQGALGLINASAIQPDGSVLVEDYGGKTSRWRLDGTADRGFGAEGVASLPDTSVISG